MPFQANQTEFRVTQTQKLIAVKALEAVTQQEVHPDDPRIDDFAQTMVIIQNGQMGGYFGRGFYWSLASRAQREPVQVAQERFDMEIKVDILRDGIARSHGEAARRIRQNRLRRIRDEIREIEELMLYLQDDFEEVMEFNPLERLQELWHKHDEVRNGRIADPLPLEA
ncbi:MAG: hypothetical protein ACU0B7_15010 [Paracoccaceae bacterium]